MCSRTHICTRNEIVAQRRARIRGENQHDVLSARNLSAAELGFGLKSVRSAKAAKPATKRQSPLQGGPPPDRHAAVSRRDRTHVDRPRMAPAVVRLCIGRRQEAGGSAGLRLVATLLHATGSSFGA